MAKKYESNKPHAPIDDQVVLPAAIRAASMRSDELHRQAYAAEEPADDAGAGQEPPAPAEEPNGTERQQTPPNTQTQAPTQKEPEAPQAPAPTDEDWKHRYNSMKGRHDQLAQTLSSTNNRVAELERLLAQQSRTVAPPQPASELSFKPIGAEERETYGEDFIDIAQRAALEKVSPEVARLNQQIAELQNQIKTVAGTTQQHTTQTIYQTLDSRVPNWREINRDPNFLAWVSLPDPYSGVTRQQMMREAFGNGDATRVLNFFTGFLNDEAATAPAPTAQPDPNKGKVPLEQFAAPGRAKAPAATQTVAPGGKETISRAQISKFYLDVNKGVYRGNDAEKNRIERLIFEAEAEGRITQ